MQLQDLSRESGALSLASARGPSVPGGVEQVAGVPAPWSSSGCSETVLSSKTKVSLDLKENAGPNILVTLCG